MGCLILLLCDLFCVGLVVDSVLGLARFLCSHGPFLFVVIGMVGARSVEFTTLITLDWNQFTALQLSRFPNFIPQEIHGNRL